MTSEFVVEKLIAILQEVQQQLGEGDANSIAPTTCPHGGLNGFISDVVPTIVRKLARDCGEPLPEDAEIINIFVSADKSQRLTVDSAAKRFIERYASRGSK